MMSVVVETVWDESQEGINNHHMWLEKACDSIYGAELIGLYRPLNEPWNWAHFMKVESLEIWRDVDEELHRLLPNIDDNVFYSMSRTYAGWDRGKPAKDLGCLRYLVLDLCRCKDVTLGIQEYYNQNCDYFEDLEGSHLFGLYVPWTENWNWVVVKMFDSLRRYKLSVLDFVRRYKRIPEIMNTVEKVYERYEP